MHLIFFILTSSFLFGNKGFTSDTLLIHSNKEIYSLKENFIYPKSLKIEPYSTKISPDSINYIKGLLHYKNTFQDTVTIVLKYKYLVKDLPIIVGYNFNDLDKHYFIRNKKKIKIDNKKVSNQNNLFSSGSINRQLNISSNGLSEFSGGLNLSLSGKLENDIMLSAVLSDEDIVIQPEGNTRNLEDFDQMYISLNSSNFGLNAGDIQYKNNIDKLVNIERNVIGINGKLNFNKSKMSALLASTSGQYANSNIEVIDGVQGPYGLISNSKSKDIQLIAGSENVWLDGRKLIRGANFDYVIDYSLAEITFTAKNLIHFDSDVSVDYEYVDDNYPKSILGTTYETKISDKLNVVAGIHREIDNESRLFNDSKIYQQMKGTVSGSVKLEGAIEDSIGKYFIDNGIYIFDPLFIQTDSARFNVVFTYNSNGNYEKLISDIGEIYYSYVQSEEKNNLKDYYSPFQNISAPSVKDLYFTKIEYNLGKNISANSLMSRSSKLENTIATDGISSTGGIYEINLKVDSLEFRDTKYGFSYKGHLRDKKYNSLNLDRDVQFNRIWDIDSANNSGERRNSLNFYINQNDLSSTNLTLSNLKLYDWNKSRLDASYQILRGLFNGSNFQYSEIFTQKENSIFTSFLIRAQLKYLYPFLKYKREERSRFSNYKLVQTGLDYTKNRRTISLSITNRDDEYKNEPIIDKIEKSKDFLSSVHYIDKNLNGWRKNITLTKRLKNKTNSEQLDYLLGSLKLNFRDRGSPFEFDFNATTEQTQSETFSIVYDSVGIGLGEYRFDESLNTYIKDQYGSYVSYSVPTGSRSLVSNVRGYQRFSFDVRKLKKGAQIKINFNTNFNYSGSKIGISEIYDPKLQEKNIYRSYLNNLSEIDLGSKNFSKRIKFYSTNSKDFQGYDPRGNEILSFSKNGINGYFKIKENSNLKFEWYHHIKDVESNFILERSRKVRGSWNEISFTLNEKRSESEFSIKYGVDHGRVVSNSFIAQGIGINYSGRLFFGELGSVMLNFDLSENKELSNFQYIPPEALNGQTLGKNIAVNTSLNYFIKKDISFSMSVNYLDNLRYNNLFTIMGEFRAYL